MAFFSILLLIFLMGIGVPVAWAFAVVLGYLIIIFDVNTVTLMLQGFRSLDHIVLLALPLFVLTGYLMKSGGIAQRLVDFIELMVGNRKGGMGASMVMSSGVFGAISGTATAAVASIGTIMVDPLSQRGYPRGYSSALLGMSSLLGILIPPSITLILFGVATRQSITALFAATIGPGILLLLGLIFFNRFCVGRLFNEKMMLQNIESKDKKGKSRIVISALPALSMPIIILGGIYGGVFTPTEAASVAVVTSLIIGFFIYRDLTLSTLRESVVNAAETTGTIILVLLFSFIIGKVLVAERVPQELTELMTNLVKNPVMILLLVNAFLIFAGAIMDDLSVTVVIAPLFMPLMMSIGVDPIHFGAIVACSVVIGANSPPVAPILYMACRIGKVSIHKAVLPAIYLILVVGMPVMLATTFIPSLSLYIPKLLGVM